MYSELSESTILFAHAAHGGGERGRPSQQWSVRRIAAARCDSRRARTSIDSPD